jgi:two-component system response regulator DesR
VTTTVTRVKVVIAEDQTMVRGALAALLGIEPDIEVVGTAADGAAALALVSSTRPDVVLTDIEMPRMTGLELAAALRRDAAEGAPRVIILTTFARPGYLRRALDAGACGYLLKDAPAEQLADAVRRAACGLRVVDPALAQEAWAADTDPLTDRERQVLRAAEEGLTSADIATRLGLSDGTVRNYLSEIIAKLGVSNRIEAARLARQKGWL